MNEGAGIVVGQSGARCRDHRQKPSAFLTKSRRAAGRGNLSVPGAGDAVPGQDVHDPTGITDRSQGWAVNAPELVPVGDLIHAIGMVFEPAGVKPGRGSDRSANSTNCWAAWRGSMRSTEQTSARSRSAK